MQSKWLALVVLNIIGMHLYSQNISVTRKDISFNNYNNKYYYKGSLFSGIMKSNGNEITFVNGSPNGIVRSVDKSGKLYRKLYYFENQFEGEFFTETYRGVFLNDTVVNRLVILNENNGKKIAELSCDRELSNKFLSFNYHENGSIACKGVLVHDRITSSDLGLRIEEFIAGKEFYSFVNKPITPWVTDKNSYFFTSFYPNGKISYTQIFNDSLILGAISYYNNGNVKDSMISMKIYNIQNINLSQLTEINNSFRSNCQFWDFDIYGKLIKKYTKYKVEELPFDILKNKDAYENWLYNGMLSNIYFGEFIDPFPFGGIRHKWYYDENGVLDKKYYSFYENGKIKIKANLEKGRLVPSLEYFRSDGSLRLKVTGSIEDLFFEEFFKDGTTKYQEKISGQATKSFMQNLKSRLEIGEIENSRNMISEDEDLISILRY